jgi:murein DD-endopeptidase MepM/ murein hydrolase activator NlpD
MRTRAVRRGLAITVAGSLVVAGLVVGANAVTSVSVALKEKRDLQGRIEEMQEGRRLKRLGIHQRIRFTKARLKNAPGAGAVGDRTRARQYRLRQLDRLDDLREQERELFRTTRARVNELQRKRGEIAAWIESMPLQRCPLDGQMTINDNFGIWHDHGKDGGHVHQGVDIGAATGTPIIAPFDGNAVQNPSDEGGQAVELYGADGHVYNAHLSAYGKLGAVKAGDVIGYVGMTGNATGPHLHFEWHPGGGAAVDPYSYLTAVC